MKNAGCQLPAQPDWYRLHYCGLCKSIGRKYDQKSRFLVNYDAVFLAELLTLLSGTGIEQWDKAIKGYQCFSLPIKTDIPIPVDYASDVNMLLAQLRVRDNKADDGEMLWSTIETIFHKPFSKIPHLLQKWSVDETEIQYWLRESDCREHIALPSNLQNWQQALVHYATPTACITAYFFALGAEIINKPEAKGPLYNLGYRFGELIYALDAIKDLPEDVNLGQFNPLSAYFGAERSQHEALSARTDYLWELSSGLEHSIQELPLPEEIKKSLRTRLVFNLSYSILGQSYPCQTPKTGIERSTLPRTSQFIGSVLALLNPAYPGKFALSYLLSLCLLFGNKLMASAALIAQKSPENLDWGFLSVAISFPVLAYLASRRIKKVRIALWLKRVKEKIKKKIAKLKAEDGVEVNWTAILIILLLLLLILVVIVVKGCTDSTDNCCQCFNSECGGQ